MSGPSERAWPCTTDAFCVLEWGCQDRPLAVARIATHCWLTARSTAAPLGIRRHAAKPAQPRAAGLGDRQHVGANSFRAGAASASLAKMGRGPVATEGSSSG